MAEKYQALDAENVPNNIIAKLTITDNNGILMWGIDPTVDVRCPFCGEITQIPINEAEPVIAGCAHLDSHAQDENGFTLIYRERR